MVRFVASSTVFSTIAQDTLNQGGNIFIKKGIYTVNVPSNMTVPGTNLLGENSWVIAPYNNGTVLQCASGVALSSMINVTGFECTIKNIGLYGATTALVGIYDNNQDFQLTQSSISNCVQT